MVATVAGIHLGIDTHANRPAANTVPDGSIYSCSTHSLVYKSNFAGNSWATWATLGSAASGSITASGYTMNTARLLGRTTASSGAVEEITVGSGLSLSAGALTATGSGFTPSIVGAHNSSDLAVNATESAVAMDTDDYDADGYHDTSSNKERFTVPTGKGGKFRFGFNVRMSANPGNGYFVVRKQTANVIILIVPWAFDTNNNVYGASGTNTVALADGDYLEFKAIRTNACNIQAAGTGVWCSAERIGS